MYSTRPVYTASGYPSSNNSSGGSTAIQQNHPTATSTSAVPKKAPLLPAINVSGSRSSASGGTPSSAIVPSEDQEALQRPSTNSSSNHSGSNISITINDSNTAPLTSTSSSSASSPRTALQALLDAKVQSAWLRYHGKSPTTFSVKYAMLNPPKPKPMAEDALTVDIIPSSGVPQPTSPSSPPMSVSARSDGKASLSAVLAVPPAPLSRSDRKWMYCAQVAEAARYQRKLYDRDGRAKKELLCVARDVEEGVRAANNTFEMASLLSGGSGGSGVGAARLLGTRGGRSPHSPNRNAHTRRTTNYMLMDPRPLRDLISDVHILLAPTVTKDMTQSVAQQLWKLKMFQSSGFPLEIDVPSPTSTASPSPTTSPANQDSR